MKKTYTAPNFKKLNSIGKMTLASSGSSVNDGGTGPATAPNKVPVS